MSKSIEEFLIPKFELGQSIWLIKNNKVVNEIIYGVLVRKAEYENKLETLYCLEKKMFVDKYDWVYERALHSSKEELLTTL